MKYSQTTTLDSKMVTVYMSFEGDILPLSYRWPAPARDLTGVIVVDGQEVFRKTVSETQPKRSYGRGDVSETFGSAIWGRAGADYWRAVRRDLSSHDDRLRALLAQI